MVVSNQNVLIFIFDRPVMNQYDPVGLYCAFIYYCTTPRSCQYGAMAIMANNVRIMAYTFLEAPPNHAIPCALSCI